ncbi:MAG: EAL domain-containing protein [Chloroflexi bacterium]|nr:EAL domain-containing protein [Chloroflexota bacterium]
MARSHARLPRLPRDAIDLRTELERAVEGDHFGLEYQPIIDLQSGAIAAVEALLRWRHPLLGTIAVSDYLPIAAATSRPCCRTSATTASSSASEQAIGASHSKPGANAIRRGCAALAGPACHDGRRSCAAARGCLRSPADPATACRGRCGWVAQGATTGSRIRRRTQRLRHTGPHRGGARPGASLASIVDGVRLRRLVMGQLAPGPASRPGRLVGPRRRALLRERGRPG